eukprot:scaffold2363_cov159-Amphora_coffeaeformis.AAC.8
MFDYQSNYNGVRAPLSARSVDSPFDYQVFPVPSLRHPMSASGISSSKSVKNEVRSPTCKRARRNSKDKGADDLKPKRPLSAYNLFFKQERIVLLESLPVRAEGKPRRSHGKLGFVDMARIISHRWKNIDERTKAYFDHLAHLERDRYDREMSTYHKQKGTPSQPERYESSKRTPSSPPSLCSASSTSSHISDDSSTALSIVNDMEPIDYEPNVVDLTMYFDNDMINILEKTSW